MQQGDQLLGQLLSGQVDGQALGRAMFDLLPSFPWETAGLPVPLPRILARQLGFPGAAPPRPAVPLPAPPVAPPAPPVPAAALPAPPAPAAPPPAPGPRSVRIDIHERRGMM